MASTYTLNNGIELIGTGEQSGTWGDTTNTNLSLLDTALDGQVTVTLASAGTSGSPNTLPISDGAASDGRNRMVIFNDGGDLGATAYVQLTPNDAEKIIYIRNDLAGSRSIIFFQGTYNASNDYEVPAGTTAVIYFDGAGSGAVAANVFNNAYFDSLRLGSVSVTAIIDDDTMATASATNIATSESIKAYVDTQVGANNELSEVLANGNTTGGTDIAVSAGDDITFTDTSKAIFGAGSDLQIYHDGSNSYIAENGTGNLRILGDQVIIANSANNEFKAVFNSDGAVELKYDNATKIATVSTGIEVDNRVGIGISPLYPLHVFDNNADRDMDINGAGQLHIDGNGYAFGIALNLTGANIYTNSASRAVILGTDETERLRVAGNGDITFFDTSGNASFVYDESAGSVFNEQGDSKDFRVESSGQTHMLFVDGANNRVGIGTSSPGRLLTLFENDQPVFQITNNTSGAANTRGLIQYMANGTTDAVFDNQGSGSGGMFRFMQAGTERLRMTTSAFVANEGGSDYDFRVEGDTNANALFVDGATSSVSIGGAIPNSNYLLNVVNSQRITGSTSELLLSATNAGSGNHVATIDVQTLAERGSHIALTDDDGREFGIKRDYSSGSPITRAILYADDGTTQRRIMDWGQAGNYAVFNEEGNDMDFRVESDGNANMLFVDAGANFVSIGTSEQLAEGLGIEASSSAYSAGNFFNKDSQSTLTISNSGAAGIGQGPFLAFQSHYSSDGGSTWTGNAIFGAITATPVTSGNTGSGKMRFFVSNDGAASYLRENATFYYSTNVFNEDSNSIDFRIESANQASMFFVDANVDRVGVATSSPTYNVDIQGATTAGAQHGTIVDGISARINGTNSNTSDAFLQIGNERYAQYGPTDAGIVFRPSSSNNNYYPGVLQTCHRSNNATSTGVMRWYNLRNDVAQEIGLYEMNQTQFAPLRDNVSDLGGASYRFDDIYATNATIQTSDRNEKQDIEDLSEAELRVATAAKGLIKKYRWIDAVQRKGDDARVHVGVIAQDLQAAFEAEGLNADDYAMFIRQRWWSYTDERGLEERTEDAEEAAQHESSVEHTRLGVRYSELFAFIIAAL